ncbi:alternative ribosome rescue aminoacyl-tRNA hydrolase ArfB [Halotalea alkalilenta]|uniref:alternative ribosome rescue aminoacyl-tRNA hydrolase ArfB n=1 Tax=Halotalea alkalilenta TaxID=376489 RepID=UPI0004825130|nr:alternative ribosome rescue aminoacyl-tRNA hydrolase ArfB [Halotalea alkalilenta]
MLVISPHLSIPFDEIETHAVRAQGAGGQNVNKVASAIHLRFDIRASSLPPAFKHQLLSLSDQRVSREGVIVIKAQSHRTQERNREDALARLKEIIAGALAAPKPRWATQPTRASKRRRLDSKQRRGQRKALRGKVES